MSAFNLFGLVACLVLAMNLPPQARVVLGVACIAMQILMLGLALKAGAL